MKKNPSTRAKFAGPPSNRSAIASAMFGLMATPHSAVLPNTCDEYRRAARMLCRMLKPGQIAFVTGPSGSGKSSILREFTIGGPTSPCRTCRYHRLVTSISSEELAGLTGHPEAPSLPIVDLFELPLDKTLSWLARVGLAEASLFSKSFRALSDGQKHRVMLAVSLASLGPGSTLLIDEFCTNLDRLTARAVSESLRKWLRSDASRVKPRLIVATSHEDILSHLEPQVIVRVPLDPSPRAPIGVECVDTHTADTVPTPSRVKRGRSKEQQYERQTIRLPHKGVKNASDPIAMQELILGGAGFQPALPGEAEVPRLTDGEQVGNLLHRLGGLSQNGIPSHPETCRPLSHDVYRNA